MDLIGVLSTILHCIIFTLLIFGLIQCKKHSFKEGFYFFLILIFQQLDSYFAPLFIDFIYEKFMHLEHILHLSTGITFGDVTRISFFINKLILCIAIVFLVIGIKNIRNKTK